MLQLRSIVKYDLARKLMQDIFLDNQRLYAKVSSLVFAVNRVR